LLSLFRLIPTSLMILTLLIVVFFISEESPAASPVKHSTSHGIQKKVVSTHSAVKPGAKKTTNPSSTAAFNPNVFIPYYNQARQFYQAGHYVQAEKPLKQAYTLAEQVLKQKPSELQRKNVAIVSQLVGLNAFQLKKYKESEVYLKKALNFNELPQYQAERQDSILTALLILGQMAMYDARYTEAQGYYQRALPLQESKFGAEAAQTKQTQRILNDIANIDYGPDYLNAVGKRMTHWTHPEQPIAIYIADGSQLPGWKPENIQIVRNAYAEWQQALGNRVHFVFVEDTQAADTVVSWMERPKQADSEEESENQKELRNGECQTQVLENTLAKDNILVAL
jgi:tetratricopeptide (TPR) repeat protein